MNESHRFYVGKRAHLRLVCSRCATTYTQQERVHRRSVWKDRCRSCRGDYAGLPAMHKKCLDCSKPIWPGGMRCKSCAQKKVVCPRFCADCGTAITRLAKARCLSCHNKKQDLGLSRSRTKFNASSAWADVRNSCFDRDGYTCQSCSVRGGNLHAHHKQPYKTAPLLRLELSNLVTLCASCHAAIHGLSKKCR